MCSHCRNLSQKHWCAFGHKFAQRNGLGFRGFAEHSKGSPSFTLWIDVVWQCLRQFPDAFEFNQEYLVAILDHLYACRFSNFLYDNERERVENGVTVHTGAGAGGAGRCRRAAVRERG